MADQPSSDGQPQSDVGAGAGGGSRSGRRHQLDRGTAADADRWLPLVRRRRASRSGSRPASGGAHPPRRCNREISAGGVVYRRDGEAIEVVLASRRTRRATSSSRTRRRGRARDPRAQRCCRCEETGYIAEIESSLGDTRCPPADHADHGVALLPDAVHRRGPQDRDDEMEEVRWFCIDRALKRAAYRGEREVLGRAAEITPRLRR